MSNNITKKMVAAAALSAAALGASAKPLDQECDQLLLAAAEDAAYTLSFGKGMPTKEAAESIPAVFNGAANNEYYADLPKKCPSAWDAWLDAGNKVTKAYERSRTVTPALLNKVHGYIETALRQGSVPEADIAAAMPVIKNGDYDNGGHEQGRVSLNYVHPSSVSSQSSCKECHATPEL